MPKNTNFINRYRTAVTEFLANVDELVGMETEFNNLELGKRISEDDCVSSGNTDIEAADVAACVTALGDLRKSATDSGAWPLIYKLRT